MFREATMMDFALKMILLFLVIEVPCFIAKSKQFNQTLLKQTDIKKINVLQNRWMADLNYFADLSESEIRSRMGSRINPKVGRPKPWHVSRGRSRKKIPINFDSREQWPDCYVIGNVKDQANCGSCWAVTTASAYSDRRCIAHKQKTNLEFSSEDILSCCSACFPIESEGDGCLGGYVAGAWEFIRVDGVVTGGDYGSRNTCKPYSIAPCKGSNGEKCDQLRGPKCQLECTNKDYEHKYKKDKRFGGMVYSLDDEKSAKLDMMERGPFVAMLRSCYDLIAYKTGIYYHVYGPCDDFYHAVKVIGWGQENDIDYWLAVNTWNTSWGENGLFRIDKTNNNADFGYFAAGVVKPLQLE